MSKLINRRVLPGASCKPNEFASLGAPLRRRACARQTRRTTQVVLQSGGLEGLILIGGFCTTPPDASDARPRQVQRQQTLQNLLVAQVCGPAVRGEHRLVQLAVGEIEPGGALIVEVGESALF